MSCFLEIINYLRHNREEYIEKIKLIISCWAMLGIVRRTRVVDDLISPQPPVLKVFRPVSHLTRLGRLYSLSAQQLIDSAVISNWIEMPGIVDPKWSSPHNNGGGSISQLNQKGPFRALGGQSSGPGGASKARSAGNIALNINLMAIRATGGHKYKLTQSGV